MPKRKAILLLLFLGIFVQLHAQQEKVVFSAQGGFYDSCFYLTLDCQYSNHHVRYTTNGGTTTAASPRYEKPLLIDQHLYSNSDIYTVQVSPENLVFIPDSIQHAIVIRAAVFNKNDSCISDVFTNTYLIRDLIKSYNLPVVSICADSLSLFDYESGIMVPGASWDPSDPDRTGNYYQTGMDWERKIHFEFIEPGKNSSINQLCGLRTHGNRARRYPNKGFKLYAREEYGLKYFNHNFFDKAGFYRFKRLVLKPYSTLWPYIGIQDHICVQLALQLGIDAPFSRPVRLYLNGEYWGLYYLQERIDEHYLEDHYHVDVDKCCMIQNWSSDPEFGNPADFRRLMKWLDSHDARSQRNYDYVCEQIDIENFIDYIILETFVGNYDWPANNTRLWKEKDGKWRWVFYDGDATLTKDDFAVFDNATYDDDGNWPSSQRATLLFRKLFDNDTFRQRFRDRIDDLCDGFFQYNTLHSMWLETCSSIESEIPLHAQRFGKPESVTYWKKNIKLVDNFMQHRVASYKKQFDNVYVKTLHKNHPDQFSCFPNPTHGSFYLLMTDQLSDATELRVFDLYGHLVLRQDIEPTFNTPLEVTIPVKTGIYLVKIGNHCERIICL